MNGWIKIHRKMVDWEWYSDQNVKLVFLHLLLKANYRDKKWNGIMVTRGQVLTSRAHLAKEVGLSINQLRGTLTKLKTTGEVTIKTTNRYTLITIENYGFYQDDDEENDQQNDQQNVTQTTSKSPANHQQTTTTKEYKNNKKDKKDKEIKNKELRFAQDDRLNDAILEFAKMRKSMRKPMTDKAIELMLMKLNQMTIDPSEQVEIINQSIMNGWLGIFPLKSNQDDTNTNNPFLEMLKKGDF